MVDFNKLLKKQEIDSMSIDFLNSICTGIKASESPDFKPHPLGEFHGVVIAVENKYVAVAHNSVIELKIDTTDQKGGKIGRANYNEWMFTDQDIMEAQNSQEGRDRLNARIGRIKRLFVDLGVFSAEQIDHMHWSRGRDMNKEPGLLESIDLFKRRKCSVTVKANTKPNKPAMVFVNAATDHVTGVTGAAPQVMKQAQIVSMQAPSDASNIPAWQQQSAPPASQPHQQSAPPMHPQHPQGGFTPPPEPNMPTQW